MTLSSLSPDVRKLLTFGTGIGIQVGPNDLELALTRVRASKVDVLGRHTITDYTGRPAAEWGAEYEQFLKTHGARHLTATVLLPRRDVIVRQVSLPGVSERDIEGAIRFQLDTLHPYGDEDVVWGWSRLRFGAMLVGIVRRKTVEQYHRLFTEAGVFVSSFTFSAAALHAAVRLNGTPLADGFVALSRGVNEALEVYGESPARPIFSAEFEFSAERAAGLALSELRLPPDTPPRQLEEVLPKPAVNPIENDLSRNALPYATALAGACPRLAPSANVLPAEWRRANSRAIFIPTMVLAGALLLTIGAMAAYSSYSDRQYLSRLRTQISALEPQAQRAAALDQEYTRTRARTELLDHFRQQTRADLDALNELTRLIEAPGWVNSIDLLPDSARITGQTPNAAPLLKILDSSKLFENSVPDFIGRNNTPNGGENFQIHTSREGRR